MQIKTQQVETDVKIVQPTDDTPGGYLVQVNGRRIDYANPDLFRTDQRTLKPVKVAGGVVWELTDR